MPIAALQFKVEEGWREEEGAEQSRKGQTPPWVRGNYLGVGGEEELWAFHTQSHVGRRSGTWHLVTPLVSVPTRCPAWVHPDAAMGHAGSVPKTYRSSWTAPDAPFRTKSVRSLPQYRTG